jgi:hypothetical protein
MAVIRNMRTVRHASAPSLYNYLQGVVFTNGAQQWGFQVEQTLPLFDLIGPATAVLSPLMITQPPQVFVNQAVPVNGIGGLQAGQLFTQPLVDANLEPIE